MCDSLSVCLSVCPHSERKTAWAISTKVGTYIVHGRNSACTDRTLRSNGLRTNPNPNLNLWVDKWVISYNQMSATSSIILCSGHVSVCLSVTNRLNKGTRKWRRDVRQPSYLLSFFGVKDLAKFEQRLPNKGAKCAWCGLKSEIFDQCLAISQKRCMIWTWFLSKANRKLGAHMRSYRLVLCPVTLSDP